MDVAALALAFVLVLANGFFVAVEFALVKVRPTQLKTLAEQGAAGASHAMAMRERLEVFLAACQVGITLASLGLGWVGEPAFARWVEPAILFFAPATPHAAAWAHTLGLVFAFGLITFLHIVLGEQVPKMLAIQRPEGTALAFAFPMRVFYALSFPLTWVLNAVTRRVSRSLGVRSNAGEQETLGEDELRMVFASSAESGMIALPRAQLLERVLTMVEKTARQVMVPRSQMAYLDVEEPLEKNLEDARAAGHTWLPVCRGTLDRVEGLVNVKDLFFLLSTGGLKALAQVQRPVLFVPETISLEQLLAEFRRRKKQMAVVVDEHGGTSGIVSIADVAAELVGEIAELGRKREQMRSLPGGKLELPGSAQLDDLEHTLEIKFDIEPGEVATIAGWLMARLGRVPREGDRASIDEYQVLVVRTDGPRVLTVRIEPRAPAPSQPKS